VLDIFTKPKHFTKKFKSYHAVRNQPTLYASQKQHAPTSALTSSTDTRMQFAGAEVRPAKQTRDIAFFH
jgi:hypothetical protein